MSLAVAVTVTTPNNIEAVYVTKSVVPVASTVPRTVCETFVPSVVTVNTSLCVLSLPSVATTKYFTELTVSELNVSRVTPPVVTGSFVIKL